MDDFKSVMTASEKIDDNMEIFANYLIESRFPSPIDGLKSVARRILYILHKKYAGVVDKELTVCGDVVRMHPHGDASINKAISILAQPFSHNAPLVFSESNIGTYRLPEPAAPRYVDVGESDIAKALFFTDINESMFTYVTPESGVGLEPAYFIPIIPTSLLVPAFAIAVGFQSQPAMVSIEDLCKLTKEYIKLRKENVDWSSKAKKLLYKYLLPEFPTHCVLRNSKKLLEAYKNGNFDEKIQIDGVLRVYSDKIIVSTLPPDKSYDTITYNEGEVCAKNSSSWESKNFQQMSEFSGKSQSQMFGKFVCTMRRGVNPFDALATLKKKLQFTSNWKPERRYSDVGGIMVYETPFTILNKWYNTRYNAVLGDLKQKLREGVDEQRRLSALITICDDPDAVYKIFKTSKGPKETVPKLVERFKLTRYQATFIASLTLSKITQEGRDDLKQQLKDNEERMKALNDKFSKVNELMIEAIEKFEKEYIEKVHHQTKEYSFDLKRRCVIPKFIGEAVYKQTGHILVENEEEFDQIITDFGDPDQIELKLFSSGGNITAIGSDEDFDNDVPKYLKASYVDRIASEKFTGCICLKGGALVAEGLIPKYDNMREIVPISKQFSAITKQGYLSLESVNAKNIRKNPSAGPTMKDVIHISPWSSNDLIVIHGSSSQPNNLMIERVDLSKGPVRLHKIVVGEWKIIGVFHPCQDRIYVNIPQVLRQRCTTRHIVFTKLGDFIKTGERLNCNFGRTTIKSDFELVPIRKKSSIVIAKLVK